MLGTLESRVPGVLLSVKVSGDLPSPSITSNCTVYSIYMVYLINYLYLVCTALLLGVLVFNISLYSLFFLGKPIFYDGTPFGGVLLMPGWSLLFLYTLFYKSPHANHNSKNLD